MAEPSGRTNSVALRAWSSTWTTSPGQAPTTAVDQTHPEELVIEAAHRDANKTLRATRMNEPRFPALDATTMTPRQKEIADKIAGGPRGGVRGPFLALIHHPDLADVVQHVGEH